MTFGINMVSWRDFAQADGYGQVTTDDVRDLRKALFAGNAIDNPGAAAGEGFPLRIESLEQTLKNTTFRMEHVRFWRGIPKGPAFNTVEEFNRINDYGSQRLNSFIPEGGLPEETDSTYERAYSTVKFLGTTRRVNHVMSLVKPAHGNVIAQETIAGTMKILRDMERNLFFARSDLDALQFDGIEKLIEDGAANPFSGVNDNIIDLRGAPLSQDVLIDAAMTIQDAPNFGRPTHMYLDPKAKSDLLKSFFPSQRYDLFSKPDNGMIGLDMAGFTSPAGDIMFEPDVFITDGDGDDGSLPTSPAGQAGKRPLSPTASLALAASASGALNSLFLAGDAGTYNYQVVAVNSFGESAPLNLGSVSVTADQKVTVTVAAGAGSTDVKFYKLYRTANGGAAGTERLIKRIPVTTQGATILTDLNEDLPGTSKAFMIQQNEDNLRWKQLAPMIKVPLATVDSSIRWMQLIYGVIQMYSPRRNVVFKNIGRSANAVGAPT